MGRKKKDPAVKLEHDGSVKEDFEPLNAPIEDANPEIDPLEITPEIETLLTKSAKALREELADDEEMSFHLGMRKDSPIDNCSFLGVSFERKRGHYDRDLRAWSFEPGRVVSLPPRLAAALKARSEEVWVQCAMRQDRQGRTYAAKVIKKVDLRSKESPVKKARALRNIKRNQRLRDPVTGDRIKEWFPLSRFVILQKKDKQALTSYDAFQAERASWADENEKLRNEIEQLRTQNAALERSE